MAKVYFLLIKQTVTAWIDHKAPRLGAALAFYSILSLGPLLLLALAAGGFLFGDEAARGSIVAQIQDVVGREGAHAIQDMIADSAEKKEAGMIASLIGLAMLLFGASGVFGQLQDAMNTIWNVQPKKGASVLRFIRKRFLSFSMVLGACFLLLLSLVVSALITAFNDYLFAPFSGLGFVIQMVNFLVSLGIISLLFAMMFKYLPDARVAWRDVRVGAVMTALLFSIGKFAIGLYLGRSSFGSTYGAAGSLVVVLVWVYYSAQIFFLGAEFTRVYASHMCRRIMPDSDAERAGCWGSSRVRKS